MLNGKNVGAIGILHPEVLKGFELSRPVSCFELDFTAIFDHFKNS
jgi:phenylalanyl-tRNA synthetase beta subunit